MATSLIIHGHFYQPPRENPWTESIGREPSASPYLNWNERIYRECYRPNAFARIVDAFGRVERVINNYAYLSFNFGPTLLSWMQTYHPETYARIIEADKWSVVHRSGHGNAIAQAYNHVILPLCNERDRKTQVRWGIADFRHRFGRDPESLWLPETACNDDTLGVLIDEGLRYAILSPHQAERVRPLGQEDAWRDVSDGGIDPGLAYRYFHRDDSGRSIVLFFYDGPIARAIAFEGALASSDGLLDRFGRATCGEERVVHVATDGESYGHHYAFGDRCLAYALDTLARTRGFEVTNYGEYLDKNPATQEVEIKPGPSGEGTAWSCSHGVGRWVRDCGCQTSAREGWNQAWRGPLRKALDLLRDRASKAFEASAGRLFIDPWQARDEYIQIILDRNASREDFLIRYSGRRMREAEQVEALSLLEMQRNAMLMYTSCGWFFADISGIETVQILKYAGRVLDYMEELNIDPPRDQFKAILARAKSNIAEYGTGADVFRRFVEPSRVTAYAVAAHLLMCNLLEDGPDEGEAACYLYKRQDFQKDRHGRLTVATTRILTEAMATGRQTDFAVAAMHFGGIDFYCALKLFPGAARFKRSADRLWSCFRTSSLPSILRVALEEFGPEEYGLEHVLPDGRKRISDIVFGGLIDRFSQQYAHLYDDNLRTIDTLQDAGFDLPPEIRVAAEFTLGQRFQQAIRSQQAGDQPGAYHEATEVADVVARRGYRIDRGASNALFSGMITDAVRVALDERSIGAVQEALALLRLTARLGIEPNLDEAQEIMLEAAQHEGIGNAPEWRDLALRLDLSGHALGLGSLSQPPPALETELPEGMTD